MQELKTQHAVEVKALESDKKNLNGSQAASTPLKPPVEFKGGKPVLGSKAMLPTGEIRSLFDTATDQTKIGAVKQPAGDDATAPPP